jgi:hypothetical protein
MKGEGRAFVSSTGRDRVAPACIPLASARAVCVGSYDCVVTFSLVFVCLRARRDESDGFGRDFVVGEESLGVYALWLEDHGQRISRYAEALSHKGHERAL